MNYIPPPLWTTIFHKRTLQPSPPPRRSSLSPLQIYIIPQRYLKNAPRRMPKNEWCNVFSKVFWDFWKWTFIFVHFWFFISRFEKNVEYLTQTIMLTIVFLSWKNCDDKFWTFCIRLLGGFFVLSMSDDVYKIFVSE